MENLGKKVEIAANIAIIAVAIMIGVVIVQRYFLPAKTTGTPTISLGSKVVIPDVEWAKQKKSLVLALQEGCHYCSDSAGFYQQLIAEAEKRQLPIIAVLPQPVEVGRKYLSDLKISVRNVRQSTLQSLGVRGTPTILLVDNEGKVAASWVGKLSADAEKEVIAKL